MILEEAEALTLVRFWGWKKDERDACCLLVVASDDGLRLDMLVNEAREQQGMKERVGAARNLSSKCRDNGMAIPWLVKKFHLDVAAANRVRAPAGPLRHVTCRCPFEIANRTMMSSALQSPRHLGVPSTYTSHGSDYFIQDDYSVASTVKISNKVCNAAFTIRARHCRIKADVLTSGDGKSTVFILASDDASSLVSGQVE